MKRQAEKNLKTYEPHSFIQQHHSQKIIFSSQKSIDPSHSQYYDQYQSIMKNVQQININCAASNCQEETIYYHPNTFYPEIITEVYDNQNHPSNVIELKVHLSYFTMRLFVYFQQKNANTKESFDFIAKGAIGAIYKITDNCVLKTILLPSIGEVESRKQRELITNQRKKKIKLALKQFCFYKIASVLKVGPKIINYLTFDLVIYDDCVQFTMEKCQMPTHFCQQSLLSSIKILHALHIVHGDIKDDNIMYSPAYQKLVLIDFNCSSIVEEEIGQKTLTIFKGTPKYCLDEMNELIQKQKEGFIDLYFNDLYGYKKLGECSNIHSVSCKSTHKIPIRVTKFIKSYHMHLTLRYCIYIQKYDQATLFLKEVSSFLLPEFVSLAENTRNVSQMRKKRHHEQEEYFEANHQEMFLRGHFENETLDLIKQTMHLMRLYCTCPILTKLMLENFGQYISDQESIYFFNQGKYEKWKQLISFRPYNINMLPKSEKFASIYSCLVKDKQLNFWKKSQYSCQIIYAQLQEPSISLKQTKKLYYELLSYLPSDDILIRVVNQIWKKLELPDEPKILNKMKSIDLFINKKEERLQFWKLRSFRKKKQSWVCQLIRVLCSFKELSSFHYVLFRQYPQLIDLVQFIKNCQERSSFLEAGQLKFYQIMVYRIFRQFQFTLVPKTRQLPLIQKTIKKYKKHILNKILYQITIFHIARTFSEFKIKRQRHNSTKYFIISQQRPQFNNLISEYSNYENQLVMKLKMLLSEQNASIGELVAIVKELEQNLTDIEYLQVFDSFFGVIEGVICMPEKSVKFYSFLTQRFKKFFCKISTTDLCRNEAVCQIHRLYKSFLSLYLYTQKMSGKQQIAQYFSWIQQQPLQKYQLIQSQRAICFLKQGKTDKIYELLKHTINSYCLFQIIEDFHLFIEYLKTYREVLRLQYIIKSQAQFRVELQILADRFIYLKNYGTFTKMMRTLFCHGDFMKLFELMEMMGEVVEGQSQETHDIEYTVNVIVYLIQITPVKQLSQKHLQQFLIFYSHKILREFHKFYPCSVIWLIFFAEEIYRTWKLRFNSKEADKLFQLYEQSILVILKIEKKCSVVIKRRIVENMGMLVKNWLKMIKKIRSKSGTLIKMINPQTYKRMSWQKCELGLIRKSIYSSKMRLGQISKKLLIQIKDKNVRSKMQTKIDTFIQNKKRKLLVFKIRGVDQLRMTAYQKYYQQCPNRFHY